jgi:hypothetical protein
MTKKPVCGILRQSNHHAKERNQQSFLSIFRLGVSYTSAFSNEKTTPHSEPKHIDVKYISTIKLPV